MCCSVDAHFLPLFSLVLLSIHQLLISLLHSWISSLPSTWNRIPGWRLGVGKRATLSPDKPQKEIKSLGRYVCYWHISILPRALFGLWWWPGWECPFVNICDLQTGSASQVGKGSKFLPWKGKFGWQSSFPLLAHESGTRVGQPKEDALLSCYLWSSFWLRQWPGI